MDLKKMKIIGIFKDPDVKINGFSEFRVGSISFTTKKVRVDMQSINKSGYTPYTFKFDEVNLRLEE